MFARELFLGRDSMRHVFSVQGVSAGPRSALDFAANLTAATESAVHPPESAEALGEGRRLLRSSKPRRMTTCERRACAWRCSSAFALLLCPKNQAPCFHSFPHSFTKTPGVGYPPCFQSPEALRNFQKVEREAPGKGRSCSNKVERESFTSAEIFAGPAVCYSPAFIPV